jgi:hypothetical protein
MKNLYKLLTIKIVTLFLYNQSNAQITVYSETFDGAVTWTLNVATGPNDPTNSNYWVINDQEGGVAPPGCGVGGNGNNTLHITNTLFGGGAKYNAGGLCGLGLCVQTNKRAESPNISTIGMTNLTLKFDYIANGQPGADFANVQYNDGSGWQTLGAPLIAPICGNSQGLWTAYTVNLPASCENIPNLRIGFNWTNNDDGVGTDPSVAINNVIIEIPNIGSNSIVANPITPTSYCAGDPISVSFLSTGTFAPGNQYQIYLSDANGSFANPTLIGSLTSTANSGTINGIIPAGTPSGTGYQISITSTTPLATSGAGGTVITINPSVTPSVSITPTQAFTCVGGGPLTFTATAVNGGTSPTYQWQVNGFNVMGTGNTFTSALLNNNDVVTCILTSNAACAVPATATSDSATVIVTTSVLPTATIQASQTAICAGTTVNFTATNTNGGANPIYNWMINGISVGTGPTFSSSTLNDGDVVICELTSDDPCANPTVVTSNTIIMNVSQSSGTAPVVNITATNTTICQGVSVSFNATATNLGPNPVYQWQINGVNAGTGINFSSSTLNNNDAVTCVVTCDDPCGGTISGTSNSITMTVNPSTAASVSISASQTNFCSGTSVDFTATPVNGGTAPDYQWFVNGAPVGTNSPTFTTTTLTNNAVITCEMTNTTGCTTPPVATSNSVTVTVSPSVTVTVTISTPNTTFCPGDAGPTFSASFVNGGTSPTYQWFLNGNPVGTNSPTFTLTPPTNGDVVTCQLTSSLSCSAPTPAISNPITLTVFPAYTPVITEDPTTGMLSVNTCAGCTYQWNNVNVPIPGQTNSSFMPLNGGFYSVTVTDPNGCKFVTSAFLSTVSVEENSILAYSSIFPNPANSVLNIKIENITDFNLVEMAIIDLSGRIIKTNNLSFSADGIYSVDISNLPVGLYILKLQEGANSAYFKFVKN